MRNTLTVESCPINANAAALSFVAETGVMDTSEYESGFRGIADEILGGQTQYLANYAYSQLNLRLNDNIRWMSDSTISRMITQKLSGILGADRHTVQIGDTYPAYLSKERKSMVKEYGEKAVSVVFAYTFNIGNSIECPCEKYMYMVERMGYIVQYFQDLARNDCWGFDVDLRDNSVIVELYSERKDCVEFNPDNHTKLEVTVNIPVIQVKMEDIAKRPNIRFPQTRFYVVGHQLIFFIFRNHKYPNMAYSILEDELCEILDTVSRFVEREVGEIMQRGVLFKLADEVGNHLKHPMAKLNEFQADLIKIVAGATQQSYHDERFPIPRGVCYTFSVLLDDGVWGNGRVKDVCGLYKQISGVIARFRVESLELTTSIKLKRGSANITVNASGFFQTPIYFVVGNGCVSHGCNNTVSSDQFIDIYRYTVKYINDIVRDASLGEEECHFLKSHSSAADIHQLIKLSPHVRCKNKECARTFVDNWQYMVERGW